MELLGPDKGYTDLLDEEIVAKQKLERETAKKVGRAYFPLRPSAAGYCSRRLGYELMEFRGHDKYQKELFTPNVWKLLNLGHSIEYSVIRNLELLVNHGYDIRYKQQSISLFKLKDTKTHPGEIIEGSCDGVLWSEKHRAIFDVKSVKDGFSQVYKTRFDESINKFKILTTMHTISETAFYIDNVYEFFKEVGPDEFLNDNILQLCLYANSPFMKGRGVDHAVIYKHCKNDSREYEIRFRPEPKVTRDIEAKFNLINECVSEKRINDVPRDFNLGSFRCAYCPFSAECWGTDTKKAYWATWPEKEWPVDTSRLKNQKAVELTMKKFLVFDDLDEKRERAEQEAIKLLVSEGVKKIRLKDGSVWEVKELKSPKPHLELRRCKQ